MAQLSIRLFGCFEATLEGEPVTGFASDKVRALLAYLAVESDRPHRREALCGLLWPDYPEASARANLRRALANLRTAIGDRQASPPFLSISHQTVRLDCTPQIWCDVTEFVRAMKAARSAPQSTPRLEEAVGLYRGDFLDGFSLGDSVAFEEWLLLERERLRREALAALRRLATHYEAQSEYRRALPYARQQVELEVWQEEAQRQLMRVLALDGQRGLAVAQYESCRRILAEQLGVEPAVETTRLYERIRDGAGDLALDGGQMAARQPTQAARIPPPSRVLGGSPGWHTTWVRLALIAGSLLLLAVLTLQVLMFLGTSSPGGARQLPEHIVAPPAGKIVLPCPDVTPPQICVHELRNGLLKQVTHDLEFEEMDALAWSPDGQQIVFDAGPAADSVRPGSHHLYVIDADGSDLRQVTGGDASSHVPAWSPDGEWIAFNRWQELWLVRPDGSEPHRLFGERGRFCVGELSWSPDSRQIAFLGQECPARPVFPSREVWVVNRDGSGSRAVHTFESPPTFAAVHWEPDGLGLVCDHSYAEGGSRLLRIDPRGSGEPLLIDILPLEWSTNYWPQWGRVQQTDD